MWPGIETGYAVYLHFLYFGSKRISYVMLQLSRLKKIKIQVRFHILFFPRPLHSIKIIKLIRLTKILFNWYAFFKTCAIHV